MHLDTARLWIDGRSLPGEGDLAFSQNPVDGELLWSGHYASVAQVDAAIHSARAASADWACRSLDERVAMAKNYAKLLQEHRDSLAKWITRETGKTLWESLTEVATAIAKVDVSITAIENRRWTQSEKIDGQNGVTRFKPLGVMLVLGPYNFPLHLPGSHMVPALLAGNTIVFKPSEQAPAIGQYLNELWQQAGLPKGVVNLIHGRADVARHAVVHPDVDGILFTGSYRAGAAIHQSLAGQPHKMIALEMGGNNPLVVCTQGREQMGATIYAILQSAFITSGQRCSCARRLILPDDGFGDLVLDTLIEAMRLVTAGHPQREPQPFLGSVIHLKAARELIETESRWLAKGAKSLVEMRADEKYPTILYPGLVSTDGVELEDEEWFGPLLRVERSKSFDHAIELANRTSYGLTASLLGGTSEHFESFVQRVRAGVVNWNRQTTGASGRLPFGGIGRSGNHRPSAYYAADYCSHPIASLEGSLLELPKSPAAGLEEVYQLCSSK